MEITAKVIQQSRSALNGILITTFELEYPRYIHAEFLTHRVFSRNAASSRAIPVSTMLKNIVDQDVGFSFWGKNQPGMQSKEELYGENYFNAKHIWEQSKQAAIEYAKQLNDVGLHKQSANRGLEPYSMIKVVMTATELENWFELRAHEDAQPEIQELAIKMRDALKNTCPIELYQGEWHVPYVDRKETEEGIHYYSGDQKLSLEDAIKVSASCCAQVSYRKNDTSLEKAQMIYDKLINSRPMHASPIEHQATPAIEEWQTGVTHVDRWGNQWSGNFKNWIQYRQTL